MKMLFHNYLLFRAFGNSPLRSLEKAKKMMEGRKVRVYPAILDAEFIA